MKYSFDRFTSAEFLSKIVDISVIAGITTIILFTLQAITHTKISSDIQQSLVVILVILVLAAINIFSNIINKDSISDNQIAESIKPNSSSRSIEPDLKQNRSIPPQSRRTDG
jgi:hypothetical protein